MARLAGGHVLRLLHRKVEEAAGRLHVCLCYSSPGGSAPTRMAVLASAMNG